MSVSMSWGEITLFCTLGHHRAVVELNHPASKRRAGGRGNYSYLSLPRLLDLLLLAPLNLLEHLALHDSFSLLDAPQHFRLDLVLAPLQLLCHSLRHQLLYAAVGCVLDRLLLGLLLAPSKKRSGL